MNITIFELTQAFIESIAALTSLISAGVVIYKGNNKTTQELKNMFLIAAVMLVCDGSAYIFRGNTGTVFVCLTQLANYGVFLMNIFLLVASSKLILATRSGDINDKQSKIYMKVIYALAAADLLILVGNIFTKIMFYFDAENYYHRNPAWYVYTALILFGGIISVVYIFFNRKELSTGLAITLIIYELLPFVLSIFQTIIYGISITVTGVAIGTIIVMYSYFFSVEAVRFTSSNKSGRNRNYPLYVYTAIVLLIVSMSAAFITCISSFGKVLSSKGIEEDGYFILQNIWPGIVIFYVGIIIMLGLFILMFSKEWHSRKQSEENRLASIQDELTGALNRRAYERALEAVNSEDKDSLDFAVIMFDINGLKSVNDTLGHKAGDDLIKGAAECITDAFSEYGTIYRIGGDEFAVFIHSTKEQLLTAIERVERSCHSWKHSEIKELSISMGFARAKDHPDKNTADLVKTADQLMYDAKNEYYKRTGKERRKA